MKDSYRREDTEGGSAVRRRTGAKERADERKVLLDSKQESVGLQGGDTASQSSQSTYEHAKRPTTTSSLSLYEHSKGPATNVSACKLANVR